MTAPEVAAARFAAGLLLGLGLGISWDLLKPLARRHPHLADGLFLTALGWAWLELGFGICGGDLRLGYTAALGVGWAAWELTLGRALTPLALWLWDLGGGLIRKICSPFEKILKNFFKFCKKIFASTGKWVTIRWNNRRRSAAETGGKTHAKALEFSSPRQAGGPQKSSRNQGGGPVRRGAVRGGASDPAKRHSVQP